MSIDWKHYLVLGSGYNLIPQKWDLFKWMYTFFFLFFSYLPSWHFRTPRHLAQSVRLIRHYLQLEAKNHCKFPLLVWRPKTQFFFIKTLKVPASILRKFRGFYSVQSVHGINLALTKGNLQIKLCFSNFIPMSNSCVKLQEFFVLVEGFRSFFKGNDNFYSAQGAKTPFPRPSWQECISLFR